MVVVSMFFFANDAHGCVIPFHFRTIHDEKMTKKRPIQVWVHYHVVEGPGDICI